MENKSRKKIISWFDAPISNVTPNELLSPFEIYKRIVSDAKLKVITKSYRTTLKDKHIVFPSVTWFGSFKKRNSSEVISSSNYFILDIDGIENVKPLKAKLVQDKFVHLCFTSPSGKGIKILIKYELDSLSFSEMFDFVVTYFEDTYNVTIDKSGKDIARACFICYDKTAHFNDLAHTFTSNSFVTQDNDTIAQIECCIRQIEEQNIDITEEYKVWIEVAFALASIGEDGREYFHRVSANHSNYSEKECDKQFTYVLKSKRGSVNIGTFFHHCKENGIRLKNYTNPKPNKLLPINGLITASERIRIAQSMPPQKTFLGGLFFEKEVHVLFADTNVGKTIFAVALADAISKGISFIQLQNETNPQKVLYLDCELSTQAFAKRYVEDNRHYNFSDNLLFSNYEPDEYLLNSENKGFSFEDWIFDKLEKEANGNNIKVVFIDNITFLMNQSNEDGKIARELITRVKRLQKRTDTSIFILAHSPKRNLDKILNINDLGGSKHIANFVDSITALNWSSQDKSYRYLKQLKSRNAAFEYDMNNVIILELIKEDSFLGFHFVGFSKETEHLATDKQQMREIIKEQVVELYEDGLVYREIAEKLGISHTTVMRYLKN